MKYLSIFVATISCLLNVWGIHCDNITPKSVEAYNAVTDHYWRDFKGLVPSNAIQGGRDINGAETYVGQFTTAAGYGHEKSNIHVIPATIRRGNDVAIAPYMGKTVYSNNTNNVMILCASYTARYRWYSPTAIFPPNCRFVIGGYEDKSPMFIGRATQGREVITGKIFADTSKHRPGLIIPYEGGELYPTSYEVLTYCY